MNIRLKMVRFTVVKLLLAFGVTSVYSHISKYEVNHKVFLERQLQILKLFNNLNCARTEDKDLEDISNSFNPLDNLNLYKNPETVQKYFTQVLSGKYLRRDDPFTNDPEPLTELTELFDIFFYIDDWKLFYKTAAYASARVNAAQCFWALSTLLSTKFVNYGFKSPPAYEIFPQFFTPKEIIRNVNTQSFTKVESDPEDALVYFRRDPSINSFHLAWHVDFPFWWKPDKYKIIKDRKGELFIYLHHQLLNRYKADRLSNPTLKDFQTLILDEPIEEGDVPDILNINFSEFPSRERNSKIQDLPTIKVNDLLTSEMRIRNGISQGYFISNQGSQVSLKDDKGIDYLGAAVEASAQSVNKEYYGNLHNRLHRIISKISDPDYELKLPPGTLSHPETAVQDPVFFRIHQYINDFHRAEKYQLRTYSAKDIEFPGIDISSVKIAVRENNLPDILWPFESTPIFKTYFEDFTYDVSNAVMSCDKVNSGENFTATVRRLNHKPFEYSITAFSHKLGSTNGTVRIFMSPANGYDGKPYSQQDLHWNMIEMDKFPVVLANGHNVIRRSSRNSSLTIPDLSGFKELIKQTKDALSRESIRETPYKNDDMTRLCGYPHHLLLPKGTPDGMKFKMLVIITDAKNSNYDEKLYPSVSLCGAQTGIYPDGKPMGFPFDRKVSFGFSLPWFIHGNYRFLDVEIKHENKS